VPNKRRSHTPEFKREVAKMVVDIPRPVAMVAREQGVRPRSASQSHPQSGSLRSTVALCGSAVGGENLV